MRKFLIAFLCACVLATSTIKAQSVPPSNIEFVLRGYQHVELSWYQNSNANQIYLYKVNTLPGSEMTIEFLGSYLTSPGINTWQSGDDQLTRHMSGDVYFIEEWLIAEDGQSNQKLGRYGPFTAIGYTWFPIIAQ